MVIFHQEHVSRTRTLCAVRRFVGVRVEVELSSLAVLLSLHGHTRWILQHLFDHPRCPTKNRGISVRRTLAMVIVIIITQLVLYIPCATQPGRKKTRHVAPSRHCVVEMRGQWPMTLACVIMSPPPPTHPTTPPPHHPTPTIAPCGLVFIMFVPLVDAPPA